MPAVGQLCAIFGTKLIIAHQESDDYKVLAKKLGMG